MPPSSSTLCQPKCGIIAAATKPPAAEPSGKPQNMVFTSTARRRCGANSDVSVTALGMAAPRPRPVRKRQTVSQPSVGAYAVARLQAPKKKTDSTSTFLRPMRSASGPAKIAPKARPNRAALMTGPRADFSIPQSCTSAGAIYPMAAVSKPSTATTRKQSTRMSHW
ncbi:hypothetical protein D3C72_1455380 [compost metagenome]